MRKFLFRAWNKSKKEMSYSSEWNEQYIVSIDDFFNEDSNVIFMQFTGLLDKNGKDIYEGDIVRTFDYKATIHKVNAIDDQGNNLGELESYSTQKKIEVDLVVKYNETSAQFILGNKSIWPASFAMEVIGNIYESPIPTI